MARRLTGYVRATLCGAVFCATAGPVAAKAPPAEPPSDANLFVYRDYAQPRLAGVTLWIDLKKVATLRQHQYTAVRVFPGPHILQLRWPKSLGQTNYERVFTVKEGDASYLVVSAFLGAGTTLALGGPDQMRTCCRYKAPEQGR